MPTMQTCVRPAVSQSGERKKGLPAPAGVGYAQTRERVPPDAGAGHVLTGRRTACLQSWSAAEEA